MSTSLSRIALGVLLGACALSLSSCGSSKPQSADKAAGSDAGSPAKNTTDGGAGKVVDNNTLTFSNTQTWDPKFLEWAQKAPVLEGVDLPPPPGNTSADTQKELQTLHAYQKARTPDQVKEIESEINIENARFGDKTLTQLCDENRRPNSAFLLIYVFRIESLQVMRLKKRFDRVRPSYLDPTLKSAIPVPAHPAYPSGHATQAFLRARVLGLLDPKHSEIYLQSAERIAHNREIAGLHYPSDSLAGRVLADELLAQLMRNPNFVTQLRRAKREW